MTTLTAPYPLVKPTQKRPFNFNLESLRGVVALVVVWGHANVLNGWLDPSYYLEGAWSYNGPAHLGVLAFFVLSGYVIGLAYATPLKKETILTYLKKRFIRLYPIYLVCLLLGLAVTSEYYSGATLFSHLVLLQGLTSPVIVSIGPSWSLAYEALFYLLFIPISVFRINPVPLALLAMLIGGVNAYFYPQYGTVLLSSYAFGFAFWLCGLSLARYQSSKRVTNYAYMISALFLFLAIGKLNAPVSLLHKAGLYLSGKNLSLLPGDEGWAITFSDFGYLPYCLLLLVVFTGRKVPYQKLGMAVLLAVPAVTYYAYYTRFSVQDWYLLVFPTVFYSLAILFFLFAEKVEAFSQRLMGRLVITGSISYGLYLVHFPVLYLFGRIDVLSGTLFTFLLRFVVFLALVVGGAYFLEKKFQPWIKSRLQALKAQLSMAEG